MALSAALAVNLTAYFLDTKPPVMQCLKQVAFVSSLDLGASSKKILNQEDFE